MNEIKPKDIDQGIQDDVLSQLNTNLYALAGYLAEFLAMIRRTTPRTGAR